MPTEDLRTQYNRLVEDRREYLDAADQVAALTLPEKMPTGHVLEESPSSYIGTEAVSSLAGITTTLLIPPGQKFLEYRLTPSMRSQIRLSGVDFDESSLAAAMSSLESEMSEYIDAMQISQVFASMIETLIIEHTNMIIIDDPEDELGVPSIRAMPLRSFVIDRISGRENFVIIREQNIADPEVRRNTELRNDINTEDEFEDDLNKIYTKIDYMDHSVWQQTGDQRSPVKTTRNVAQYVVASTSKPIVGSYQPGHAYRYVGTMKTANDLMKGLRNASAVANWIVLLVSASGDPHFMEQIQNIAPLTPAVIPVGSADTDAKFLTSGTKIGDWSFVSAFLQKIEQSLESAFAMGIARRRPKTRTAEEVIQIRQELDRQVASIVTTMAAVLRKVIEGIGHVVKIGIIVHDNEIMTYSDAIRRGIRVDPSMNLIRPSVVTGMTALTRDTQLRSMLEGVALAMQVDQTLVQKLSGSGPIWLKKWASNINFDIGDILEFIATNPVGNPTEQMPPEAQAIARAIAEGNITPEEGARAMNQVNFAGQQAAQAAGQAASQEAGIPA